MKREELEKLSREELLEYIDTLRSNDSTEGVAVNYRSLVEAASEVIFVLERDGTLVYHNQAFALLCRGDKEGPQSGIGRHYTWCIPDIEKKRADFVFNDVMDNGKTYENELMKTYDTDNQPLYFISSFTPIRTDNGDIHGLLGMMKNITHRYVAEKKLKEKSRMLEEKIRDYQVQAEELKRLETINNEIINNAPIGIFMMDPSGHMLSENQTLREIIGYSENDSRVGFNLIESSRSRDQGLDKLLDECLRRKETIKVPNLRYSPVERDTDLILNVTLDPVVTATGAVKSIIVMVEDHTREFYEQERRERDQKLSIIGILAAGVAEELRSHLNTVTMDLNFVENNIERDNPSGSYITNIKGELTRMRNISEQLLCLVGPGDEQKEPYPVHEIFRGYPLETFLASIKDEGYKVTLSNVDSSVLVRATASQLKQLVFHLLMNAVEGMAEPGAISIDIEPLLTDNGPYVMVTVTDQGMGIPEENRTKIFQPFFTTKGQNSTGLGLMVVAHIVENLGGTIALKSKPTEGSSFTVAIPQYVASEDGE